VAQGPPPAASTAAANPPMLLDVRWVLGDRHGEEHYRAGHIPGAVYVALDRDLAGPPTPGAGRHPLPTLDALQVTARRWGLREGTAVVVYDDNGGLAAARAWWLLRWVGVTVRILDGALAAWRAAGFDLATSTGRSPLLAVPSGDVVLDARAGERYRGETEPIDPRAGHIPGALSAPTGDNLTPDGRFAAPSALRSRFARMGAADGGPVGVYCGSGVTAAHQIAALHIAGIDAALFPGSWSAWSTDPDRPVATGPPAG
jgi:thiosulfate/3-mercaptopyruvate sulfurtransferase